MKYVPVLFTILMLAGGLLSCKHYPTEPHLCDTCCDTCHKHCDTCDTNKPPCDTCNIDKDSAAHAFIWTEYSIDGESSLTGVWVFDDRTRLQGAKDEKVGDMYFSLVNGKSAFSVKSRSPAKKRIRSKQ